MPVTICPEDLSDEPSLPGSEDSFEATQAPAVETEPDLKAGSFKRGAGCGAGSDSAEKDHTSPDNRSLLQGDQSDQTNQGVAKPPSGN